MPANTMLVATTWRKVMQCAEYLNMLIMQGYNVGTESASIIEAENNLIAAHINHHNALAIAA